MRKKKNLGGKPARLKMNQKKKEKFEKKKREEEETRKKKEEETMKKEEESHCDSYSVLAGQEGGQEDGQEDKDILIINVDPTDYNFFQ